MGSSQHLPRKYIFILESIGADIPNSGLGTRGQCSSSRGPRDGTGACDGEHAPEPAREDPLKPLVSRGNAHVVVGDSAASAGESTGGSRSLLDSALGSG